jgi:magnesium-transporting ATPase (P-type)
MTARAEWEGMGALSGVLATLVFVLAFLVLLTTDPTGSPPLPAVEGAEEAPAYIAAHLNAYRLVLLFTTLGVMAFLWFLGSLWATLKGAEAEPGRGSALALTGAAVGSGLMLVSLALGFTAGLSGSPVQADTVPTLYVAGALLFAMGGGVLAVFFFGVARVILQTRAMARWLGVVAFIVALLCIPAFLSPFFDSGVLDAATGIFGRWLWYAGFVIWVFLSSLMLTLEERRRARAVASAAPSEAQMIVTEGEGR